MKFKRWLKKFIQFILFKKGYEVVPALWVYDWQKEDPEKLAAGNREPLPETARSYLRPDHPRLVTLRERYDALKVKAREHLLWKGNHVGAEDLLYFRGDNAYVWQLQGLNGNIMGYALASYYAKSIDHLGLLNRMSEDGLFGSIVLEIGGERVSRDLLDSLMEIYFLEKHLKLSSSDLTFLDIGAGYGRLAHRLLEAYPERHSFLCTDAVEVSSFLCEYYLDFRGMKPRAISVPLDEIERTLSEKHIDVALNIHSFSECSLKAIEWWVSLLEKHRIRYLMVVPNTNESANHSMFSQDQKDYRPVIEKHGYRLVALEPKYGDPVIQKYGLSPAYHYLFEKKA